jgi:hypothetical protein
MKPLCGAILTARLFILLLLILGVSVANAQYATPDVISTTGGSAVVQALDLDIAWTLGESVILTLEGSANVLTNGFHQSDAFCPGDFNFDGLINTADLLIFLSLFGCTNNCLADLNNDNTVNTTDLLAFLSIFGTNCYGNS